MRRPAAIAAWLFWFPLLAAPAGCSWFGLRDGHCPVPTPEQAAMTQEINERAQGAIDRGEYELARLDLQQLVAANPKSAQPLQRLGSVLELEGRLADAEKCFRCALSLDHDYVQALIGLGEVEALKGDSASALRRFETAIEIDPHRPDSHIALGRLLEAIGKTDQALTEYFRALEFDANNPDVILRIAAIQLARSQPDQALSRLDQAVELAASNGAARALRGQAYLALRQYPQAAADFKAAASRLTNRPDVYYNLALALEGDHKLTDARRAAAEALRLAPGHPGARQLSQRLALVPESAGNVRNLPRASARTNRRSPTEAPADAAK
jgi:tetratricopeptide (TPR) repeat protein